ncbi:MAG: hypothetical protein ACRENU_11790 [Gemmatimonadaceae bacterium]
MRLLSITAALAALSAPLVAQPATLNGVVLADSTRVPVANAG